MNKTSGYDFTIDVPIYNEEDNMERLGNTLKAFLPRCTRKACVLFVDDGSRDGSLDAIKSLCGSNSDFFYISFVRNCGLSAAIKAGFDTAESPLVGYMDADLQTSPEDFNLLLADIDSYSMVTGIRTGRKDTWSKRFQSKFANGFRKMFTHDGASDTGCPLKVFHIDVARRIPMFKGLHRFFPAMVLLQEGGSYKQVPVRHFPRTAGKSKFSIWNRLIGPLNDCFAYRWMRTRYINYNVGDKQV